jgi:SAM-dependent methyltransferase
MANELKRRDLLVMSRLFGALLTLEAGVPMRALARSRRDDDAQNGDALDHLSNFKAVYADGAQRAAFFLFLKNVYNLFPEQRLHELIAQVSAAGQSDKEIYQMAQRRLGEIKPILADVRYALPALARQKIEMAHEMLGLLGAARKIDGYMEIGTTGRYISQFRPDLQLSGEIVLLHTDQPGYSPVDLVERGRLRKLGRFVPLNDYAPIAPQQVADGSLDLISNFIGFHHSPLHRLEPFVASLHRVLRAGGRMVVRDHDVSSAPMNRMVALAHDVFNLGLGTDWSVNQSEIRHFTSIAGLTAFLEARGFRSTGKAAYQRGDPTHNALMEFVRL